MKSLLYTCVLALCASTLLAQQIEVNDAAGSLTSNGANPVVGTPFDVSIYETLNVEIGGNAHAGFILVLGELAPTSTPVPGGESFDLDIAGPLTVLVDGINGGGALFPFVTGNLNPNGEAEFAFPMASPNNGQIYAMQAVTFDAMSMFNLNFTAAGEWLVNNNLTLSVFGTTLGDQAVNIPLPVPFTFYGQTVTQMNCTTKSVIDFDGSTAVDFSQTVAEFNAGTMGLSPASPCVAGFWDDIQASGTPAGSIVVELVNNSYVFTYNNMKTFGGATQLGTFSITIDFTAGTIVTIDHSALPAGANAATFNPIVGISAGDITAAAVINQVDLASAGAVNPFVSGSPGLKQTIYQGFGTITLPNEPVDTMGLIMTFLDGSVNGTDGDFILF